MYGGKAVKGVKAVKSYMLSMTWLRQCASEIHLQMKIKQQPKSQKEPQIYYVRMIGLSSIKVATDSLITVPCGLMLMMIAS